jgi:hypothetical protein
MVERMAGSVAGRMVERMAGNMELKLYS